MKKLMCCQVNHSETNISTKFLSLYQDQMLFLLLYKSKLNHGWSQEEKLKIKGAEYDMNKMRLLST